DRTVAGLIGAGCEVGVHGLHHDGRDLGSLRLLQRRLPEMRHWQQRWGAAGFRAPATQRTWDWMPLLGFDYDTSYFDTDPFEPQPGGCLSWLPLLNGDMVELPITAPQDHTLFAILEQTDGRIWQEKAEYLRRVGGMVLLLTHPDYTDKAVAVDSYRDLLAAYRDDGTAWKALPREVAAWWRRRAASRPERVGDGWEVVGPAAGEAAIRFLGCSDGAESR
ncbi:MAG TPA: hypothetical protein VG795_03945, partial [Acidimicrobiia bacterium]|nr:hypothetical protein [Acidimicrobiia bacterium]